MCLYGRKSKATVGLYIYYMCQLYGDGQSLSNNNNNNNNTIYSAPDPNSENRSKAWVEWGVLEGKGRGG